MKKEKLLIKIAQTGVVLDQMTAIDYAKIEYVKTQNKLQKKFSKTLKLNEALVAKLLKKYPIYYEQQLYVLTIKVVEGKRKKLIKKLSKRFYKDFGEELKCYALHRLELEDLTYLQVKFVKEYLFDYPKYCKFDEDGYPITSQYESSFHHSYYHKMPYVKYLESKGIVVNIDYVAFTQFPKIEITAEDGVLAIKNHGLTCVTFNVSNSEGDGFCGNMDTMSEEIKYAIESPKEFIYDFMESQNN